MFNGSSAFEPSSFSRLIIFARRRSFDEMPAQKPNKLNEINNSRIKWNRGRRQPAETTLLNQYENTTLKLLSAKSNTF